MEVLLNRARLPTLVCFTICIGLLSCSDRNSPEQKAREQDLVFEAGRMLGKCVAPIVKDHPQWQSELIERVSRNQCSEELALAKSLCEQTTGESSSTCAASTENILRKVVAAAEEMR